MKRALVLLEQCEPIQERFAALSSLAETGWLSAVELEIWDKLAGRAAGPAWLVGRWLGKTLVLELARSGAVCGCAPHLALRDLAIISSDGRGKRNRPQVFAEGRLLGVRLSLAHSERFVYAAAGLESGAVFGVDVADAVELDPTFQATWFSAAEQRAARERGDALAALRIWTAKEACYKACQQGEAFEPRRCEVRFGAADRGEAVYGGVRRQLCRVRWTGGADRVGALAVWQEELHD